MSSWVGDNPCFGLAFPGVVCSGGSVASLVLSRYDLRQPIATQIGLLHELTYLQLSANYTNGRCRVSRSP